MERRDCQVLVYFAVALAASLGLGLAIAYLEVRRSQELLAVEMKWIGEIERVQKEVEALKEEVKNKTATLAETVNSLQQSAPGGPEEDDYYYDEDEYDDEDGEEDGKTTGKTPGKTGGGKTQAAKDKESKQQRSRREIRLNPLLPPYNLVLRQFRAPHNKSDPEIKARIIVKTSHQEFLDKEPESFDVPSSAKGIAAHFSGDTSRIRHSGRHLNSRCYDANHRMCHVRGLFKDWKASGWNMESAFSMVEGELTLNSHPGIYYLYAQILYADNHDVNGYRVFVNGDPVFQCTLTHLHDESWIPSRVPHIKNSCFTGGLVQLNQGDRITIREIDNVERYSVFEPHKSYFGLFQVVSLPSQRSTS